MVFIAWELFNKLKNIFRLTTQKHVLTLGNIKNNASGCDCSGLYISPLTVKWPTLHHGHILLLFQNR